jgi:hypothetical protein
LLDAAESENSTDFYAAQESIRILSKALVVFERASGDGEGESNFALGCTSEKLQMDTTKRQRRQPE